MKATGKGNQMNSKPLVFLLVEDSEYDILAFQRAWRENGITQTLKVVRDGQACLDYLARRGAYGKADAAPRPAVIVLNDSLPRLDGQSVLSALQANPDWAIIPVVVFTSSESERKELDSYAKCASAYILKPSTYKDLSRLVRRMVRFWEMVEIPELRS
jgi:CheY-like chemotaxis protein